MVYRYLWESVFQSWVAVNVLIFPAVTQTFYLFQDYSIGASKTPQKTAGGSGLAEFVFAIVYQRVRDRWAGQNYLGTCKCGPLRLLATAV